MPHVTGFTFPAALGHEGPPLFKPVSKFFTPVYVRRRTFAGIL
jgi:hypothetical protein